MKRAKTKKEIELLEDLAAKVSLALKTEKVNMHIVAAITGTNWRTYNGILTGNRDVTTTSLLRIMDVLGYEVALVKRKGAIKLLDNPDYIARYNEYKLKNNNDTRRKRGQKPLTGNEPAKVRVKRSGITDEQVERLVSRRSEVADHREKSRNIFGTS